MPLSELAAAGRVAGIHSVFAALKAGKALKVFLSKEADMPLLMGIMHEAERQKTPIEWAEGSQQLGRACAVSRPAAAAALLKK